MIALNTAIYRQQNMSEMYTVCNSLESIFRAEIIITAFNLLEEGDMKLVPASSDDCAFIKHRLTYKT
jgi:hypothetical protein